MKSVNIAVAAGLLALIIASVSTDRVDAAGQTTIRGFGPYEFGMSEREVLEQTLPWPLKGMVLVLLPHDQIVADDRTRGIDAEWFVPGRAAFKFSHGHLAEIMVLIPPTPQRNAILQLLGSYDQSLFVPDSIPLLVMDSNGNRILIYRADDPASFWVVYDDYKVGHTF